MENTDNNHECGLKSPGWKFKLPKTLYKTIASKHKVCGAFRQ